MEEGWYALLLAIYSKVYLTPEKAFTVLSEGIDPASRNLNILTQSDIADMIKFHNEGLAWKDIGKLYGMNATTVWRRAKSVLQNKTIK